MSKELVLSDGKKVKIKQGKGIDFYFFAVT